MMPLSPLLSAIAVSLLRPLAKVILPIRGRPEVSVPVLSNSAKLTFDSDSIISPPLAIAPDFEANERLAA